ncbi:MAG: endopeptidase La [Lachnospiraceae bacterium]|jgi:ATP-dependent Lon protease|nr:endopeptidase La [Lachnospiraceae bacterium]
MEQITTALPLVALRGLTVVPGMIMHFDLNRDMSKNAIEQALNHLQKVLLVPQVDPEEENPEEDGLYKVCTVANIKQVTKLPNDIDRVMVEAVTRAYILELSDNEGKYFSASYEEIVDKEEDISQSEKEALVRTLKEVFDTYVKFYPKIGKSLSKYFKDNCSLVVLINQILINTPFTYEQKQQVLEIENIAEQCGELVLLIMNEAQIAAIRTQLAVKIREKIDKNQRDYVLREQLEYIQEELGDKNQYSDVKHYEEALAKLKADTEVKEKIKKQIARFKTIMGSSSESAVERGYIETLLELPWNKASKDNNDINRAEEILERDHYGLEKVKERIVEYLAVRCLTSKGEAPILCLVGPPGTGKTSIAKSIAEALNKKYIRICLGGVRDEAEIRGHRKTYVGAMPGRIANGLKQAGVCNPLMLLDEIDKVSSDYKGDTSSALLEVLDPEQNCHFRDHYVELPLDLSKVLFIATANDAGNIPRPLLDRMDIIEVTSYTANEKFHIAKEHLWEKQLKKNGLKDSQLTISDNAIKAVIDRYTKEAGVRNLERKLGTVCRKAALEILKNRNGKKDKQVQDKSIRVNSQKLEKYLGKPKYSVDMANEKDDVGIVRGLAWTSVGGDTLQIEVNIMPGKGEIELTGKLGDVMKESAMTGISFIRSIAQKYKIAPEFFKENDFHIHIPEGAVPKDGPSAGITMATAVLSAITDTPVKAKVAMTGEITLRGRVLPIGGLKEKLLAAKTAGITTVLVPEKNEKDVAEISNEIKSGMEICLVESMDDVIPLAFSREIKVKSTRSKARTGNNKQEK